MPCTDFAHLAAAQVNVPAEFAFAQLSSPAFVGGWALGSMGLKAVGDGVFRGESLFDGSAAHVEFLPEQSLGLVDFAVGTAEARSPRIFLRVTPGSVLGHPHSTCLVTLHALRSAAATDERWAQTRTVHETEILLIKAQLERAFGAQDA